jgi:hypothetical protein
MRFTNKTISKLKVRTNSPSKLPSYTADREHTITRVKETVISFVAVSEDVG